MEVIDSIPVISMPYIYDMKKLFHNIKKYRFKRNMCCNHNVH